MQTYRVLKPRFVFAHAEYGEGEIVQAHPTALLRRAVADGDLELIAAPAADKKRKERSEP
jgi:hypothetical protein